jgi:NarL family two-component system response regulator LiaR
MSKKKEALMTRHEPIRVLIVDDHPVVIRGLATVLSALDDLSLVGEARSGEEAIELCESIQPDVVLMDLVMPGMGGVKAIQVIRERWPQTAVIALTSFVERGMVEEAIRAGAISYLLKNISAEELGNAIRSAFSGRSTLSEEVARLLVQDVRKGAKEDYDLSDRERETLKLMTEGLSNVAIAKHLVISESTVKFHVSNILSKLGVTSRTEAVTLALRHHLVD